jgi:hypothetical protein
MKNQSRYIFFQCFILLISSLAYSQPIAHSAGSVHVYPAWTLEKGRLSFNSYSNLYLKGENYTTPQGVKSSEIHSDWQAASGFFYGFTNHLELGISQILYQDSNQKGLTANAPDDLYLLAKLGSFGSANGMVRFGIQSMLRLASGNPHNIPLESYSSNRASLGIMALVSFIADPLHPASGINFHTNLGLLSHNDLGVRLTDSPQDTFFVSSNTREILFGFSFSYAFQKWTIFTELAGRSFINKPPVTAFARENSLYITPGLSIHLTDWLLLKTAVDLRLLGGKDDTIYNDDPSKPTQLSRAWKNAPNYPDWRAHVGITIFLKQGRASITQSSEIQPKPSMALPKTQDLFTELTKERQKAEDAESDLERIRQERKRMEEILQNLRMILDGTALSNHNPE